MQPKVPCELAGKSFLRDATVVDGGVNVSCSPGLLQASGLLCVDQDDDATPSRVIRLDSAERTEPITSAHIRTMRITGAGFPMPSGRTDLTCLRTALRSNERLARSSRQDRYTPSITN
jgi:hypothetical protein